MDQENNNNPAQSRVETVVCGNCGKALRVRMPSKPGRYKFACTHCQNKVSFEVKATAERKVLKSDVLDDRVISHDLPEDLKHKIPAPDPAVVKSAPNVNVPVLGAAIVPPGKAHYQIMEKAAVNTQYRFECPGCSKNIVIMPRVAGKLIKVKCSKCGTQVLYQSQGEVSTPAAMVRNTPPPAPAERTPAQNQDEDDGPHTVILNPGGFGGGGGRSRGHSMPPPMPAPPVRPPVVPPTASGVTPPPIPYHNVGAVPPPHPATPTPPAPPVVAFTDPKGMLCWKAGRTETYRLKRGRNTIGRYDPELPSNVMIQGDDEMSRQSVEINAVCRPDLNDYIYELRVLRSLNNVYVNGRVVNHENVVQLKYGDTIGMGKTIISFVKADDNK